MKFSSQISEINPIKISEITPENVQLFYITEITENSTYNESNGQYLIWFNILDRVKKCNKKAGDITASIAK